MFSFKISPHVLLWILRLYPPLFFNRIWVVSIDPQYLSARVKIHKSFLNKNYNKAIFGGTLFMAADPFYVLLFHQYFTSKGYRIQAWLKSAHIDYLKPATTDLIYDFELNERDFVQAEKSLKDSGKYIHQYRVQGKNKAGEVCVQVQTEVYLRNIQFFEELKNTLLS